MWFVYIDRDGGNGTNGNCIQFKLNIVLMNVYLHYTKPAEKHHILLHRDCKSRQKTNRCIYTHIFWAEKALIHGGKIIFNNWCMHVCLRVCGCIGIYFSHCVTSMSTEKSLFHMHLCALLREALDQINKIMSAQNVQSI